MIVPKNLKIKVIRNINLGNGAGINCGLKNANTKLYDKSCDWIIANDVLKKNAGFNSDYNEVTIYYKDKKIQKENLSLKKKSEIAEEIVDRIVAQIN